MNKRIILSAIAVTLLGSAAVLAQGQGQAPQHPMTFFIAREVPGTGNLGGLAGADAICQQLAAGVGAGGHVWHAYLSTVTTPNAVGVNARGRIGAGPWYNAKGVMIAASVADLHGDQQRDRNAIRKDTSLDEHGMPINGVGDMPNEHDMMTGSDSDGRALPLGAADTTCNNWTSDQANARTMLGHSDRNGGNNTSWNAAHMSADCTKAGLIRTGGAGHFYCFATN